MPRLPASVPKKTVAADGSKRGIGNRGKTYNTRGPLQERISDIVKEHVPNFPIERFDAVELAALVAAMSMTERPARDSNGNPIKAEDPETGKMVPVTIPPDYDMALKALALVSRYTHSPVAPRPLEEGPGEEDERKLEMQAELQKAAESVFKLLEDEKKKDV